MNLSRLVFGVFAIGVAVTFFVTSMGYPQKAANMPMIYSVLVALLGAAMVSQEVIGSRRRRLTAEVGSSSSVPDEEGDASSTQHRQPWKAMLVFGLSILYLVSLSTVGYLLATAAFMAVALSVVRHVTWRFAAIGIVLLITVVCLVFIGFLGLPVPLLPPLLA
uniref:tripartite tricarboxylate transporter TctB family protein n=1 Tax=Halomonas sp. TaxID=1486246 RepID=UPI00263905F0|nr:tripartite tricarboxylate transporter TctB family protein [Halomonas sp.]